MQNSQKLIQPPSTMQIAVPVLNPSNIPSITGSQVVPPISVASLVAKHQPPVTTSALPGTTVPPPIKTENLSSHSPLPIQPATPTIIPPVQKPAMEIPTSSPEKHKPNVISPISTYADPLEQSLANLEHDIKQEDPIEAIAASNVMQMPTNLNNTINPIISHPNSSINVTPSLSHSILQPSQMSVDLKAPIINSNVMQPNPLLHGQVIEPQNIQPNSLHIQNNGYGLKNEFDMGNNNNGFPQAGLPIEMSISSMFDQIPPPINNPIVKSEPQIKLEESMALMNDKKPLEQKMLSQSFNSFKTNKQEPNVKNATSWSSLAKGKSPQNNTPGGSSKQQVMDSFKAFQNKAKEKADREKQRLENLELKRQQREQAERERLRAENERRREREEEDALEKAR